MRNPCHGIHALLERERRIELECLGGFGIVQDMTGRKKITSPAPTSSSAQSVLG